MIVAKTAEPHPKLAGTVYTVAAEVEQAGGRALPLPVDIRDEAIVAGAVARAVETFGGIDILINNASAISLTGTLATPVKRYDLMQDVNARGTYVCSQACLPHLLRRVEPEHPDDFSAAQPQPSLVRASRGVHDLQYGMSMCTLGLAAEFADQGVAVNSLWPRTTIATAAVEAFFPHALAGSRTPEIMADAAHLLLTRDRRSATGQFFIDEAVLRSAGVTDFERYAVTVGAAVHPDIFLD